jgi:hypothetical protein
MIYPDSSSTSAPSVLYPVLGKLLDWPFLLFIVLLGVLIAFQKEFRALLARRDISIKWGDHEIKLRDLSASIDKELDPIRDDLEGLRESPVVFPPGLTSQLINASVRRAIDMSDASAESSGSGTAQLVSGVTKEQRTSAIRNRLRAALQNSQFRWRSVERLAVTAGISESAVVDFLRGDPEVRLSVGKSGRQIAGLRNRVGDN